MRILETVDHIFVNANYIRDLRIEKRNNKFAVIANSAVSPTKYILDEFDDYNDAFNKLCTVQWYLKD